MGIDINGYLNKITASCKNDACNCDSDIIKDVPILLKEIGSEILNKKSIEYAGNFLLEKQLYLDCEFNGNAPVTDYIGRSRVISINPGSDNFGHEQRYIHCYIVLADEGSMIIGVPITNMAYDEQTNQNYLRNKFEVELVNPSPNFKEKPFNQFWVAKPSVADIRNITGVDKRRIVNNNLYSYAKYAPDEYMLAIKEAIKNLFKIL